MSESCPPVPSSTWTCCVPTFTFGLSEWFERRGRLIFSGDFCLWYGVIPEEVELSWLPVTQRPCHNNSGGKDKTVKGKMEKNHMLMASIVYPSQDLQMCSKEIPNILHVASKSIPKRAASTAPSRTYLGFWTSVILVFSPNSFFKNSSRGSDS